MTDPLKTVILLVLIAFIIIAPAIAIFYSKNLVAASVLLVAGCAAIFFTRLPDISSFELYSLKIKMEAQSKQVEVTLKQLQDMSLAFAESNLSQLAMSGMTFQRMSRSYQFALRDRAVDSLRGIGIPDEKILEAQNIWISIYCRLLLGYIAREATSLPDANNQIGALPKDQKYSAPTPTTLRDWAKAKAISNPNLFKLLDEYQSIWTTGSMKNPDLIEPGATLVQ
jgi:hypothetical protein